MNTTNILINQKSTTLAIRFVVCLALVMIAPFFGNQLITGAIVNAVIIASVFLLGTRGAILIAILPSSISLFFGLLPAVMAPMIPFIITGNIVLALVVNKFRDNYFTGGVLASIAKAGFLFVISYIMFNYFLAGPGAKIASSMMSYMQLLTALLGMILAYPLVKIIDNK